MNVKKSPYVIGIDLGTSNSSASVYYKGMANTISIDGDKSIPSVVQFKDKKKNQMLVGKAAWKRILQSPDQVFTSAKMLMKNDDWKSDKELAAKYSLKDENGDDVEITPTDIASEILKVLVEKINSQSEFDLKGMVQNAVICVPANTTDEYRNNVYQAAISAGLGEMDENGNILLDEEGRPKGVSLLEEPTAAALAYAKEMGIFSVEKAQTILVYDLGGGTFDVTILGIDSMTTPERPKFTVKATMGISRLGGDDFDRVLMEMCSEEFKRISDIDIFDLKSDQKATSPKALKEAQQKLKLECERAKIAFAGGSRKEEVNIPSFLQDGDGGLHDLEMEVKRSDFVENIQPLLTATKNCVLDALGEAGMSLEDINRVILVGGSTKADWVADAIKGLYPAGEERDPFRAENVDLIVSRGAAVEGASRPVEIDGEEREEDDALVLDYENIVTHHLGIELVGGAFGLIIEKGLSLTDDEPLQEAMKIYGNRENRDSLQIVVWKTQRPIECDDEGNAREKHFVNELNDNGERVFECIGEFELKGIPLAAEGTERVEVGMALDKENLLKVSARVLSSGSEEELVVTRYN